MKNVTLGTQTAWIDPRGAVSIPGLNVLVIRTPGRSGSLFPEVENERIAEILALHDPQFLVLLSSGDFPTVETSARVVEVGPSGVQHWCYGQVHISVVEIPERPLILGTASGEITCEGGLLSLPEVINFPPA